MEPHVAMRLKRVFPKIDVRKAKKILLLASEENCRDLEWFLERYPLRIAAKYRRELEKRARAYDRKKEVTLDILSGNYQLPNAEMVLPAREYQEVAAAMVLNNGFLLLADELGLGKTVSAIRMLADKRALPGLVVCLAHLPPHWVSQLKKFLPGLNVHVLKKGTAYDTGSPDVIIGSYNKMRGWDHHLAGRVRSVVFDECQELRRAESQKYRACSLIASEAEYTMGLSATPIYNYGGEFWNVLNAMKPDSLGSWEEFRREWCGDGYGDKPKVKNPSAFGTYLRDVGLMLRREREEVGRELPQLSHIVHEVGCDMSHLAEVENAATELARTILTQRDGFTVMRASQELSNTLRQATGIAKARYVAEFVRMLIEEQRRPVVLFGWHREVYRLWGEYLRDFNPAWYTGSESVSKKNREAQRFIAGDTKLLIMSLRSGAGLDGLQEVCSTAVIGELDWSPGVLEQDVGRVHRDGQKMPVFAYYPVAEEGSDPIMMDVIGLKRGQIEGVRDPSGNLVTKLTVDPDHVKRLAAAYLRSKE